MAKMLTVTIDGHQVQVPEGTLVVNAARQAGVDVPVFCYHPKMEPVGMCRMCLVEIGRPVIDRSSGQIIREADGSPKIQFGAKLETACTTPVSDGMVVLGLSDKARQGRKDIIEFLLTSHPLDCPVCDKGGECPLQNQTMEFGPGVSRYIYDEKMHQAKHVPLGNLIFLDRERCIQCGRCVRFQDQLVGEPVIGFFNRGRSTEIITYSEPGFDSRFSGNTTDICPVGALTTADFRFGARPWELLSAASVCNHCPVGCNIVFNVRREAVSGGKWVIKRAVPRQNEAVNEIWMCDKGRFGYHFAEQHSTVHEYQRLMRPLLRKNGELLPASWDEALDYIARCFKEAGKNLMTVASGRLANEELFNLQQLTKGIGGQAVLYGEMAGGDLTAQVGLSGDSNIGDLGPGAVILVIASDLEEEAPLWWLRIRQAAKRGAILIVANPRHTSLDRSASKIFRYPYGSETTLALAIRNALPKPVAGKAQANLLEKAVGHDRAELTAAAEAIAETVAKADNLLIVYGSEGIGLENSRTLSQACAQLLLATGKAGQKNSGLLPVWQRANDQGAWDMGFRPAGNLSEAMQAASALYIVAADPVGDDPAYLANPGNSSSGELQEDNSVLFGGNKLIVVQDLALTATAKLADVVLPVQSWVEREGSYTSGERRVQRFYPAIPEMPGSLADYAITAQIGQRLGMDLESRSAGRVMERIAAHIPLYRSISYGRLAEVQPQWPIIGRGDVYYGGASYENSQGLGVQLPLAEKRDLPGNLAVAIPAEKMPKVGFLAVPITVLYDRGQTLLPTVLIQERMPAPYIKMNPDDAVRLKLADGPDATGVVVRMTVEGKPAVVVNLHLDAQVPLRTVLVPRSYGLAIFAPVAADIKLAERGGILIPAREFSSSPAE